MPSDKCDLTIGNTSHLTTPSSRVLHRMCMSFLGCNKLYCITDKVGLSTCHLAFKVLWKGLLSVVIALTRNLTLTSTHILSGNGRS